MSVKSKHSSKKESISVKEKKRKVEDSDEDIESSEEELDLTKECHPIGYYMNDRAEMINQMFSVIKGNKLKAMLPPSLKDCDIEQLKLQCLDQLLGMSEKRITCILEGELLETSSESEVAESDQYDSDEKNGTSSVSTSNRSNDSLDEKVANNVNSKSKKRKKDSADDVKGGKMSKTESEPVEQGKTLLEILELEMRARAIRALLKQSGNEKGGEEGTEESKEETSKEKELSGDVVDLTECEDEEQSGGNKKEMEKEFDKKVSNFEEKIKKSKVEKPNPPEEDKAKRLQAELELRNKLFKKKIYRTRQQRMESEEEDKKPERHSHEEENCAVVKEIVVKQEPKEPEEIVLEDPEEGELSSSEDEHPVQIKQEPPEPVEEPEPEEPMENDFESKIDEDAERVTAIDNGTFVRSSNMMNLGVSEQEQVKEVETSLTEGSTRLERQSPTQEVSNEANRQEEEPESVVEETSWRDRWLKKDGLQKMVKSSKIYAKVKKRIAEKSQRAKEDILSSYEINSDSNSNSRMETIEGSIEEYERLSGKNQVQKDESCGKSESAQQTELPVSEIPENLKADKT